MICLKNRTFAVSQTALDAVKKGSEQLWFAWKIVLLQYHKQQSKAERWTRLVVICLKNRTFAVSQTARSQTRRIRPSLWFAWKIVLLQYHKQHPKRDLFGGFVVICLKNRTFAVSQTAPASFWVSPFELWFAWKIVLLQYHKQPNVNFLYLTLCCDLLEKSYFCSITNSESRENTLGSGVVICLKNRTFAVSQTAKKLQWQLRSLLWFAWKIVLLQYHKQHFWCKVKENLCCDLLEKSYFCSITNSFGEDDGSQAEVVICLKNRTFAVSQTAKS